MWHSASASFTVVERGSEALTHPVFVAAVDVVYGPHSTIDTPDNTLPPSSLQIASTFVRNFSHLFLPSQFIDSSDSFSQGRRYYVNDCQICSCLFRFCSYGIFPIPCYLSSLLTCFILTAYCF